MEDFDGLLSLLTLQLEALVEEVYNVLAGATTDECMKMVSSYLGSTENFVILVREFSIYGLNENCQSLKGSQ